MERIHGKPIRYVTRREVVNGVSTETVLGKEGRINCNPQEVVVVCNGREVFRCHADGARCNELLSLDGVVIEGINSNTGVLETIVAYYKYHR